MHYIWHYKHFITNLSIDYMMIIIIIIKIIIIIIKIIIIIIKDT